MLKISTLPVSNDIVIGTVKNNLWQDDRTIVTLEALQAVAQYIRNLNTNKIQVLDQHNKPLFDLQLKDHNETLHN